ncbi:von Willebrand factor A domain-containing protein 5A-like isoform X2 [Elephas maximus indicus]|nr:von Willebrand factor A domain-containing protein 5A-like isoform X2 [Elephas maximus indicus]XP_049712826.1 von Willebrand factor A domain-containing protein 5A-like isoform X2 [Elephas maximus indicus]XP_049712827.1 von Willebrand factor A domain-containing protein 5A-like isoform X2 [Elephas maximus indicus]XP_049712828.1 von Willebrand factor A domain-containing protein 5A-like isoform X2 [Elephas maximus indicus]XP_049712829.1 von Willebrand factor A domain-containing protein 5A-like is
MVPPCGLLTRREEPMPLKSISVTLSIQEFVADVSATLNYENKERVPVEAFFVFPMNEDSAVYSFEALVDEKIIVAELQDKMKAHASYENAISQGHQAFLLEEDVSSRDVFCCNVGNLYPGSKVALTLKYVQELPLEPDGALRFVFPAILNPRYHLSRWPVNTCLQIKAPVVALDNLPYTLSMTATISSQHGIKKVRSNCRLTPLKYLGNDKTTAQISLDDGHKFDRDMQLLIYYSEVHTPSVAVELGKPETSPDCFMEKPTAMVSFYPNIPQAQPPVTCGEFIFFMDRSGSMQCPMSKQDKSQLRIDAAKETLILLLKSLPVGCYFNVFGFGSSYESCFQDSVRYTQHTMEEALRKINVMKADLGGTEILTTFNAIYGSPTIPGHPLQLFVFTDGEVSDTFSVMSEVKSNSKRHRCFSFGIGEGVSTSLIKGIARATGGTSEFINAQDRMQSKALLALKRSLQPVVEDFSLSWSLPLGLSAKVLSPEQSVIFRGQRLIIYAQLIGLMPPKETRGEVCLTYKLQGKSFENKVTFSLHSKPDANFTIHHLSAKSLLQLKDMGFRETPANDKKEVLKISLECGIVSSHTAFIAISKDLNQPVQGPLVCRDIPRPVLLGAVTAMPRCYGGAYAKASSSYYTPAADSMRRSPYYSNMPFQPRSNGGSNIFGHRRPMSYREMYTLVFGDNHLVQLICLQKADGSWDLNEGLALVLGTSVEDILAALPHKDLDSSSWATVLAVLWLYAHGKDLQSEWDLLARKAMIWIHVNIGSAVHQLISAAVGLVKSPVNPKTLTH